MLWMYSDFLADFARKIRTRRSFRFHPDPQIVKGLYYATVSYPTRTKRQHRCHRFVSTFPSIYGGQFNAEATSPVWTEANNTS